MKQRLQGIVIGAIIGAMITSGTVFAASRTANIDVTYDDIQVYLDGLKVDLKDAAGKAVEPFIYNGTTYLPVRAVSNAFGKDVTWDGINKVVYLGAEPGKTENWLNVCGPYRYKGGVEYTLEKNEHFAMSGEKYTNGFVLSSSNKTITAEALFNLNGKYQSISFIVGYLDDAKGNNSDYNAKMNVYLDGIIAYEKDLKYDEIAHKITIPLNGALQMKIELSNTWGTYGFADGKFE